MKDWLIKLLNAFLLKKKATVKEKSVLWILITLLISGITNFDSVMYYIHNTLLL